MNSKIITCLIVAFAITPITQAAIPIDTVVVGNPGNANDGTGYGSVSYTYNIGKTEVTNAQYASFLNSTAAADPHGLYNTAMTGISRSGAPGSFTYTATTPNTPVNLVSFWDAARFANWLTTGDTETGVYNLGGVTNPTNDTITRDATAWNAGGVAIASENEWYKAAYYDPTLNGGTGGYWDFPTQSNTAPTASNPNNIDPNSANFDGFVGNPTDVGAYAIASSYYGTFDQGGNLSEWTDEIRFGTTRLYRGGGYDDASSVLQVYARNSSTPTAQVLDRGFRVTSLNTIPEPAHVGGLMGSLALLLAWSIRRRNR